MQKSRAHNFFPWYDPPIPQKVKKVIASLLRDLRRMEGENATLKLEIRKLRTKVKLMILACVCLCCYVLITTVLAGNGRQKQGVLELKMLN